MTYLEELAAAARPINDDDWGSERHINAHNDFFDALDLSMSGRLSVEETEKFDSFCAKATSDEMITEGLRLAAIAHGRA